MLGVRRVPWAGHYRDVLGARGSRAAAEAEGASAPLHPPRTMVAAAHSGARLLLLVLRVGLECGAAGREPRGGVEFT